MAAIEPPGVQREQSLAPATTALARYVPCATAHGIVRGHEWRSPTAQALPRQPSVLLCSAPCVPASKRTLGPNGASASARRRGDAGRSHAPTTGAGQGGGQGHATHRQGGRPSGRTARPRYAERERGTWATVMASAAGREEDRRGRLCCLSEAWVPRHPPPSGQGEALPWP